jgi:acetyltransferase-like isoleucine patch superfamily enzyme
MKNCLKFLKNFNKYYKNNFRILKLCIAGAEIANNVVIGHHFKVDNAKKLKIASDVYIGDYFYANCIGGLEIKSGSIISNNCTIVTFNHDYSDQIFTPYGLSDIKKQTIVEENCWIGINCNVAAGVTIGKSSIIGMGTTVAKNIPPFSIYAGNRIIKERPSTSEEYSLLSARTIYNPLHYIFFCFLIKSMKCKGIVHFSEIKKIYPKSDLYSMIYTYSQYHASSVKVDWGNKTIDF